MRVRLLGVVVPAGLAAGLAVVTTFRIRTGALDLATGTLLLTTVGAFAMVFVEAVTRFLRTSADTRSTLRLLVLTCSVLLFILEAFLRFGLKTHATYLERNGVHAYESMFEPWRPSWFHVRPANASIRTAKSEFVFSRTTNALGLSERELDMEKLPREYRVLALGDSFTEGIGTVYDSTWVQVLGRCLSAANPDRPITTINAGIGGSDVFFEYILLEQRLLTYRPDLVVVAINNTDVMDLMVRGGMERFQPDGSVVFAVTPPKWEWLYAVSFIWRHVVHDLVRLNNMFMTSRRAGEAQAQGVAQIMRGIDAFAALSHREPFDLLIVTHPYGWELQAGGYAFGFEEIIRYLRAQDHVASVDLFDYYNAHGPITAENAAVFFWESDGHYNGEGYRVMGDAIAHAIIDFDFIPD